VAVGVGVVGVGAGGGVGKSVPSCGLRIVSGTGRRVTQSDAFGSSYEGRTRRPS
jgi:hypothetical protein